MFYQKSISKLISKLIFNFFVLCFVSITFACGSKNTIQSENNEIVDDSPITDSSEDDLETSLLKKADSFYFADNFSESQKLYQKALSIATDEKTKESIVEKIARTKEKSKENSATTTTTTSAPTSTFVGKHKFGVQFIYNGYGEAEILADTEENQYMIKGEQVHGDEYVEMYGTLDATNPDVLIFSGIIKMFTKGCCDQIHKTGKFTFKRHKGRKFWRLQEFNDFCDQYTCAYYLDIFE